MIKVWTGIALLFGALACLVTGFLIRMIGVGRGNGPITIEEGTKKVHFSGYEFTLRTAGQKGNTPVLLLHGFPESSIMWERMMGDLAKEGYYCAAFDQRGYSPGARPIGKEHYTLDKLTQDVFAAADELGFTKFHLIGHDWGALVGWAAAEAHPDRLISYTALSVPHKNAWGYAYREDEEQFEASKYVRLFQNPVLPEFLMAGKNYTRLKAVWEKQSEREIAAYLSILKQKYALTSALNWYRANYAALTEDEGNPGITVPSLLIWGNKDIALKRSGIQKNEEYVSGYYRFVETNAGHWLVNEDYDRVLQEIGQHLSQFDGTSNG